MTHAGTDTILSIIEDAKAGVFDHKHKNVAERFICNKCDLLQLASQWDRLFSRKKWQSNIEGTILNAPEIT